MDQELAEIAVVDSIGKGDRAEEQSAYDPKQAHAAFTLAKAEACHVEGCKHGTDGGQQSVAVIVNGRIGVPRLEAHDQPNDKVKTKEHVKCGRGLLTDEAFVGKQCNADCGNDAQGRQQAVQEIGKLRSRGHVGAGFRDARDQDGRVGKQKGSGGDQ